MNYGYARVSTDQQDYEGQLAALKGAGCEKVFAEKESGAKADRPQLAKALASLCPGDVLVVCKLDRLARSLKDLLVTLDAVAKAGAGFAAHGSGGPEKPEGRGLDERGRGRR
jgi:DNA invertase Pin-like site-specific DNA recombinase